MAIEPTIKERLAALEQAVADLQRPQSAPVNWWEHIIGSFKDEPAFDEVLAHGRAIRSADRRLDYEQP